MILKIGASPLEARHTCATKKRSPLWQTHQWLQKKGQRLAADLQQLAEPHSIR